MTSASVLNAIKQGPSSVAVGSIQPNLCRDDRLGAISACLRRQRSSAEIACLPDITTMPSAQLRQLSTESNIVGVLAQALSERGYVFTADTVGEFFDETSIGRDELAFLMGGRAGRTITVTLLESRIDQLKASNIL
ncbi:MAG: hypothetical protein QG621_500 [Patescibacteria group bacterium]|jgi:hypothetical protein|nr:hypothetical protein [Patescibacteria group bacterium]